MEARQYKNSKDFLDATNSIYMRIGYYAVADSVEYTLTQS